MQRNANIFQQSAKYNIRNSSFYPSRYLLTVFFFPGIKPNLRKCIVSFYPLCTRETALRLTLISLSPAPVLACTRERVGSDRRRQTTVWYGARKDHQNVNRDTGAAGPTRRRNVLSSVNESLCHLLFVSNSPRSCALGRWNFNFTRPPGSQNKSKRPIITFASVWCRARFIGSFISSVFTVIHPARLALTPRSLILALAYVLSRATIAISRSDAFYPAHSNGRRFPVAIVGYGFPFDFGTSRSAKFHGREIFCARALIQA